MKRNQFLTLAMGAALSFASCTNDDYYGEASGNEVQLTVDITKPGFMDETRTALSESTSKIGDLDCVWTENDQVIVVNNGARVGILKLMPGYEGQETGRFDGSITGLSDGNHNLTFYYLGTGKDAVGASGEQNYKFDTQTGTLASLSANDLLISENPVTVSIDGKTGYTDDMALARQFSFAHFRLVLPSGVSAAGQTVTVSGANVMNEAVLNYSKPLTYKAGDINVTVLANDDFYMTLLPQAAVEPTFTVTVSGKTYKGELAQKDIDKNVFINEILSDVGMTRGWPITMTEVEAETPDFPTDPDYGDDYANEDTRNPLHKFAKYNLERENGVVNEFVKTITDNGALYQWGRNYGYMDATGIYTTSQVGTDYTNYLDAMGEVIGHYNYNGNDVGASGNWIYRYFNYSVYTAVKGNVNQGYPAATGTYTYDLGNGSCVIDGPGYNFNQLEWLQTQTKMFVINLADNMTQPNWGNNFTINGNYTDYWPSYFEDGGSTWADRAILCGYENEDPCPEGWRMPTEEDFKKILPSDTKLSLTGQPLSKLLEVSAPAEKRHDNETGIDYVIRWVDNSNGLKIQCIVVDADFSENRISSINWDNNPLVVSRLFPFTGNISYTMEMDTRIQRYFGARISVVVPSPFGTFTKTPMPEIGYTTKWTKYTPDKNFGSALGGYWIGDCKKTVQFLDYEKTQYGTSYYSQESAFEIRDTNPTYGFAIRPVMDKK